MCFYIRVNGNNLEVVIKYFICKLFMVVLRMEKRYCILIKDSFYYIFSCYIVFLCWEYSYLREILKLYDFFIFSWYRGVF